MVESVNTIKNHWLNGQLLESSDSNRWSASTSFTFHLLYQCSF